ncbi:MAG: hypothetical protein ACRELB_25925 [Polyangiaceae bacterium]
MPDDPGHRCGTCARFVRVVETIDDTGEVRRHGECLLGVWPSPLYDTSTCSQWVLRGAFKARPPERPTRTRSAGGVTGRPRGAGATRPGEARIDLVLPEDLLDMDAEEFRRVLAEVIRDELGVGEAELAGKWDGGEVILRPGKPGLQEKRIPLESLFNKVVMIRDKLRLLEQKLNAHPKLAADEKVQLQQYITGCYGSLTTFNVLFSSRDDQFVGQKGDE